MTLGDDSKEVLEKRANANFRKEERAKDGKKAMVDYEADGHAVRANTARLRALRLAKEAADENATAVMLVKPAVKKRKVRASSQID
jgi:murein endopeptidase